MQATSTQSDRTPPVTGLPKALLIMGPTASGKTRLAIEVAKAMNGEVISVDSALVFRDMDIGTAKPDMDEREGIPHHLIDILDPKDRYSTGDFQKDAHLLIKEIHGRGRLPILAGGTMLYFHGLLHGISTLPPANMAIRERIEHEALEKGWAILHEELKAIDPLAAIRIHPNDPQRIQRALEIYHVTGKSMTDVIRENPPPAPTFQPIPILIAPSSRNLLASRIQERFQKMIRNGLVEEVRALKNRGDLHPDLPSMRAVGYRQVWEHLDGITTLSEMQEKGVIATRQFAKRQMTWLRKENFRLEIDSGELSAMDITIQHVASLLL